MESWEVQLATIFNRKAGEDPAAEAVSAKVISPLPNISLSLGDEIILDEENLIVANRIYEIPLQPGDEVILLPTAGGQIFYLMDKVGR
ncbi:hypothetical protein [Paenibacillus chibensis]|uniref:hypothetical protein n=1 Tax=Paenibacillus chibensis TaxID=59846 RepID=UPI000FDADBD3|nr:hypothetical protein [Paenibacillus chibensis]MEC0370891.1 hypothetical protein [Paenibacillus chibensis]